MRALRALPMPELSSPMLTWLPREGKCGLAVAPPRVRLGVLVWEWEQRTEGFGAPVS